ncbi:MULTISPECIES: NAD kinase [Arthrobacter]|uniref:NAD kinase n=1 Tax=Arthrobacter terricola TaxID=2547396 RepID=A0A4R5K8P3_9MICC|nr:MULTISPECIES: NAD kinase [Arthrobacter]MBT8163816.1 NAD kinase [Arthrobacter sp. GN70]TDF91501.1 NAD kinase [Arthrobacter terricola]
MSRRVLVLAHTGREDSLRAAWDACGQLHTSGLVPVMQKSELDDIERFYGIVDKPIEILHEDVRLEDVELGMVLGGDGTILRAAELVRNVDVPLLGVNLGHVGFLAESERADLAQTVEWIASRDYTVEERMTIDVQVWVRGQKIWHTWALNEAAIEKAERERMIEVVTEVDERPLTSFGCDGVVMATPTGSTAYAFSSGGPVVWPEVEALVIVPISAHALFAKPLVVSPRSKLAVEILTRTDAQGVLWCDGRRSVDLPPGARVEVTRSSQSVRLARTHQTPFSARLVRKFELPIHGWRGPAPRSSEIHTGPIPVVRTLKPSALPTPQDVRSGGAADPTKEM